MYKLVTLTRIRDTITLLLIVSVLVRCSEKSSDHINQEQVLLNLERQWLEKEFTLDTAFLSSLMDSTFIGISEKRVKNKGESLLSMYNNIEERMKRGTLPDSFKIEDGVVNIFSGSAMVTFVVHTYRHSNDSLIERRTRFYDVWTRRGDKWKAVASQGTVIE